MELIYIVLGSEINLGGIFLGLEINNSKNGKLGDANKPFDATI